MEEGEEVLKVRDLMVVNLISVEAEDSVIDVARLMDEHNISSVLVRGKEKRFVGIITDRDMVSRVISKGLDPKKVKAHEVMSSPLITISPEASIEEAAGKMRDNKIRRLVVEEDHRQVGIISESDMIRVEPDLHFLIRERARLEASFPPIERQQPSFSGECEECHNFSENLKNVNGRWLCEECRSLYGLEEKEK